MTAVTGVASLTAVLVALAAIAWLVATVRVLLVAARMFQIEEYEVKRFLSWARTRRWLVHPAVLGATLAAIAGLVAAARASDDRSILVTAGGWLLSGVVFNLAWRWPAAKKALVFTPRLRRLLAAAVGVCALVVVAVVAVLTGAPVVAAAMLVALAATATALPTAAMPVARLLTAPVEARVRAGFVKRARDRLEAWRPLVLAVAGSYGKTSTKHILAHLLSQYGDTLPTPKSFNTLMGVTRTVNETLEQRHRTLVVEMDAYGPGEIASICDLVHPSLSVITAVGAQHLERFGSQDRIAQALYEAVLALPDGAAAVIHAGEPGGAALAARARSEGRRVVAYGIAGDFDAALDVVASDLTVDGRGCRFRWRWDAVGLDHLVEVPLLGRHQVLNVSAALAVVRLLDLPLEPALRAVTSLEPVAHRLQVVPTGNAITVIDDSYNANPVGVHNALDLLAAITAGARILVTPGLVELGSVEAEENRRYGEHAAAVCDHVIVVASRTDAPLRRGLEQGGLGAERTHVVTTLAEATAIIGRIAQPGDVVLFANDLPDTYL